MKNELTPKEVHETQLELHESLSLHQPKNGLSEHDVMIRSVGLAYVQDCSPETLIKAAIRKVNTTITCMGHVHDPTRAGIEERIKECLYQALEEVRNRSRFVAKFGENAPKS